MTDSYPALACDLAWMIRGSFLMILRAAIAEEREACALVADTTYSEIGDRVTVQQKIVAAIRARSAAVTF